MLINLGYAYIVPTYYVFQRYDHDTQYQYNNCDSLSLVLFLMNGFFIQLSSKFFNTYL